MTWTERERVELAQVAYRAYGDVTGWVNYRGEPMPDWNDLGDTIRAAWMAAAGAVRGHVLAPPPESLTWSTGSATLPD